MNTVKYDGIKTTIPALGSIYHDEHGRLYILSQVDSGRFLAISLNDGERWGSVATTITLAVSGLKLLHTSAEITIKPIQ